MNQIKWRFLTVTIVELDAGLLVYARCRMTITGTLLPAAAGWSVFVADHRVFGRFGYFVHFVGLA